MSAIPVPPMRQPPADQELVALACRLPLVGRSRRPRPLIPGV